ncbi:MAG: dihydrofolate reductase, partial [Ignavibacteriaceae bacterium]|nr:dihydrofolate reductase [Ignavibacteriaceae bacterium]
KMRKTKITLYIACSIDGFIATKNHELNWLPSNGDYGYNDFYSEVDCVIMGRKTFDVVNSFEVDFPYKGKKCIVISHSPGIHHPEVDFFNGNLSDLISTLENTGYSNIWLVGGGELIKQFNELNLIDIYYITFIPVLLGNGVRLFYESEIKNELKHLEHKIFADGVISIKYEKKNQYLNS